MENQLLRLGGLLSLMFCISASFALAETPDLLPELSAEYGYADNLNNATTKGLEKGSQFSTISAELGLSSSVSSSLALSLSGSYDIVNYREFGDLSVNTATIGGGLLYFANESLRLKISPDIGQRSYGDSERNSFFYDIAFSIEHKTYSHFFITVIYRYANNDAKQSVYSYSSNKIGIRGEWQYAPKGFLDIDYSIDLTENIFYETSSVAAPAMHGRRSSNTFGVNQVAFKENTTVNMVSLSWDQNLYRGLYAQAEYDHFWASGTDGNYHGQIITGGMRYKF